MQRTHQRRQLNRAAVLLYVGAFVINRANGAHALMGTSLKRASDFSVQARAHLLLLALSPTASIRAARLFHECAALVAGPPIDDPSNARPSHLFTALCLAHLVRIRPTEQVMGAHGVLHIAGPANCPLSARYSVFEDAGAVSEPPTPCCGMPENYSATFSRQLPTFPSSIASTPRYPHAMGFVYVAAAFERCIYRDDCHELRELPTDEQVFISRLTEKVLKGIGVFKHIGGKAE